MNYIRKAMFSAINFMKTNFISYFEQDFNIEMIVLSIFGTVIILTFFFVWLPYLRGLSNKIWRTKGMLNMIPIEVITKHESLKNAFISGNLLSAVK